MYKKGITGKVGRGCGEEERVKEEGKEESIGCLQVINQSIVKRIFLNCK